jgi:hypothetical protein
MPYIESLLRSFDELGRVGSDNNGCCSDIRPDLIYISPRVADNSIRNYGITHPSFDLPNEWRCYYTGQLAFLPESNGRQMDVVTVATSIAPMNTDKQRVAVASWIDVGLRVLSVNTPNEIKVLKEIFPEVLFIPASRNAREDLGKPLIYLDDVLHALKKSGSKVCGIINSDIILKNCRQLPAFLQSLTQDAFVLGARVDVPNLDAQENGPYYYGRDLFFFDRSFTSHVPPSGFCLGAPWWDIWLPLVALHTGRSLVQPAERFALHLIHDQAWNAYQYCKTSILFLTLINQFGFDLLKDPMYLEATDQLLNNGRDSYIMQLVINHISERTSVVSIDSSNCFSYKVKLSWVQNNPSLSLVITTFKDKDVAYILDSISEIEQLECCGDIEIVVVLDKEDKNIIEEDYLLKIRKLMGNMTIINADDNSSLEKMRFAFQQARTLNIINLDKFFYYVNDNKNELEALRGYYRKKFEFFKKNLVRQITEAKIN